MTLRKPISVTNSYVLTPIWSPLPGEDEIFKLLDTSYQTILKNINGLTILLSALIESSFDGSATVWVDRVTREDLSIMMVSNPFAYLHADAAVLRIKGEWLQPDQIAKFNKLRHVRYDREVVSRTCSHILDSVASKILVLMTCYLPGSSRCLYTHTSVDKTSGLGCVSSFEGASKLLAAKHEMIVPEMSFRDFFIWSTHIAGFWVSGELTNVGRALNFISYAHHRTHQLNTLADISWIFAALEALLTESNQEIRSKLSRRALALNPKIGRVVNKRQVGQLYDFRSSFLHGGIQISNHFDLDFIKDYERENEFNSKLDLASCILFSCLHEIAAKNWHEISFSEKAVGG